MKIKNPRVNISQKVGRIRRAFTLVELLTVLGIALLLAALVLPTVKGLLQDRKSSQAAILVKNYIEAARSRAIGKNRSVAVVLERLSGRAADTFPVGNPDGIINLLDADASFDPPRFVSATSSSFPIASRSAQSPDTNFLPYNSCIKLSMAEEPLPVSERSVPVPFTFIARSPSVSAMPAIPVVYDPLIPLVDADQISSGINEVRIIQVTGAAGTNAAVILGEYLIAGNEISFGKTPTRFTITSPTTRAPHDNYSSSNPTTIWFSILNERGLDGLGEMSAAPYVNIQAGEAWTEFRIFQKPKTIYTQTVQLPKGTCIDLSLSGFANDRSGTLSDYRVRFASDWVISGAAGVPRPDELRPIYLVFSPNGSLSRVYANQKATSSAVSPQAVRIDPVDDVFLHIGLIDQVHMPVGGRNRAAMKFDDDNGIKQNLTDPRSYILRLSPKSGAITAAPINAINSFLPPSPGDNDTLFDIVGKSRLGTYNSTITGQ